LPPLCAAYALHAEQICLARSSDLTVEEVVFEGNNARQRITAIAMKIAVYFEREDKAATRNADQKWTAIPERNDSKIHADRGGPDGRTLRKNLCEWGEPAP